MSTLWIGAGLLLGFVVLVLLAALLRRPKGADAARVDYDLAVYKDQLAELDTDLIRGQIGEAEAKAAKAEIERRILALADGEPVDRGIPAKGAGRWITAAMVGVCVPTLSLGLYLRLGTPDYPNVPHAARNLAAEKEADQRREQAGDMAALAAKLAARLETQPDNLKGWLLLGRTYLTLEREADAVNALRRALQLAPENPDVLVELGEALVIVGDHKVGEEARGLFKKALSADARRPRPRYYLSLADAQDGNLKQALQGWVDLLTVSPADAPWRPTVATNIKNAAADLKIDPASVEPSLAAKLLGPPKTDSTTDPRTTAEPQAPPVAQPPMATAPGPSREDMKAAESMSADDRVAMIRAMVQRLADRLRDEPDDLAGWQRLARAYRVLGETDKARHAEEQIKRLGK